VLYQNPSATQRVGILLVVIAGAAAQHGGRRHPGATERTDARSDLIGDAAIRARRRRPSLS